ncbi:MAG: T9SS type A sorting domain-containing protein [Bacteroidales bacterium]|nr:T9SS type A sorting domain-containing protein [Bacteroidales bacterium]
MKNYLTLIILFLITNLLLAQQNPLLKNYDVKFYKLDINVNDTSTYIEGNVAINAIVQNNPLDTLVVELIDTLSVDSVIFNGVNISFTHDYDEIKVPVQPSLSIGTNFSAKIYYHGIGISIPGVHGWTVGIMNESQVTMTNSETYHSKMWWPCKQLIEDKADSMYVFITTDSTCKAGSIGILSDVIPLPEGKVRFEWKMSSPVPYYLVFFTVSDYIEYNFYAYPSITDDSILIQCYLYDSAYLALYKERIDTIQDMIEYLSELFGLYPFERYGFCSVPTNPHENITMSNINNFNYPNWLYGFIVHIIGHQWFAGNVTCKSWQDIWIHEGFATYSSYLARSFFENQSQAANTMEGYHGFAMSEPGGSVYVPIEEIFNEERILDNRLSYCKGAALIHMIRFEIDNDSIFFQVLKNFNNQYSGGSATGMDFKDVIETTSGLDFTNFFNQWYFGEGYPIFDIYWTQNEDTIIINSIQTTSTTVTSLFVTPVEYKLVFSAGDTIIKVYQTQNDQTFKIYMPFTVNNLEVDPNNWLLNKVGVIHNSVNKINTNGNYFLIYPNPAEDFLYIEVLNDNKEFYFEIIDIFGKSVYNKIINTNKEIIDISNYSKGVYIVRVNGEDAIKVEKIIIY